MQTAKNEEQTRFTNCILADFFINNCFIVTILKTKKKFLIKATTLEKKNQNSEEPIHKFLEPKNK